MRIKQLGYYLGTYDTHVEVRAGDTKLTPYAEIWNTKIGACKINTGNIELIKLCLEYAETPIEEREEEKKYTVVLPDPENKRPYIMVLCKNDKDKVHISSEIEDLIAIIPKYHLTESEIKRNHGYLWHFAKEVE